MENILIKSLKMKVLYVNSLKVGKNNSINVKPIIKAKNVITKVSDRNCILTSKLLV